MGAAEDLVLYIGRVEAGVLERPGIPRCLKKVRPGVERLFFKGDLGLLGDDRVRLAVVGSRKMTDYGRRAVERLVPALVEAGVVIVSGFMYGVDQAAHEICLDCGGRTVAVLGWGIDRELSVEDRRLYKKFVESNSLIVSEYEKKTAAKRYFFVQRNRIVVGASAAVLVVEAAEKSGTMTSVEWAEKMGKPVLAIPGPVTSRVSWGTNSLIKVGRARMVTGAGDVLRALGLGVGQAKLKLGLSTPGVESGSGGGVARWLRDEPDGMEVDRLARLVDWPVDEVMRELTRLELVGEVEQRGGKFYGR